MIELIKVNLCAGTEKFIKWFLCSGTAGLTKTLEKVATCITAGTIIAFFEYLFGKIDFSLEMLAMVMLIDFITGIWCGIKDRQLSSRRCVEGLFRKLMIGVYVILGHFFDVLLSVEYVRIGVCYMYIVSECISIIENGTKLGAPVPEPIQKALAVINGKKDNEVSV